MALAKHKTAKSSSVYRNRLQKFGVGVITALAMLTIVPIFALLGVIVWRGLPAISLNFLFNFPLEGMKAGGIWPAIVGTIYLTVGTAVFSVPLGIGAAIYLSEYAPDNRLTQTIRIAIITLAGIPSVVYGLFGLGLFVLYLNFGTSILAGSLTLAIMNIPVIISTAEEALRSVPQAFRVVSISLGATRWQTIRRIVVPQAVPGILTGVILGSGTRRRRDGPDPFYRGGVLFAKPAAFSAGSDDGAAIPSLRGLNPGARNAPIDPVWDGAGAADYGVGDEYGSHSDPLACRARRQW